MNAEQGSVLIEMLLALVIMTVCELLAVPLISPPDCTPYYFVADALLAQSEAMSELQEREVRAAEAGVVVRYNSQGHVDQARTICFRRQCLVQELGSGRIVGD